MSIEAHSSGEYTVTLDPTSVMTLARLRNDARRAQRREPSENARICRALAATSIVPSPLQYEPEERDNQRKLRNKLKAQRRARRQK